MSFRIRSIIAAVLIVLPSLSFAAPIAYDLNRSGSDIAFKYDFGTVEVKGSVPFRSAEISLDLRNLARSTINVTLDAANAVAGFPFATQAMRGDKVLSVKEFPTISFQSTKITRTSDGAKVTGNITVRDITRPIELNAKFFRQQGTAPEDRDHLAVKLQGQINRNEFGAGGYPSYVGPDLRIEITALIDKRQ